MKHITCFAILSLAFIGCTSSGSFEVSITGLETTTYVNDKLTFNIAVTGGKADTLELRRNGELFQVVSGGSFVWDTQSTPEGTYTFVARARSAVLLLGGRAQLRFQARAGGYESFPRRLQ